MSSFVFGVILRKQQQIFFLKQQTRLFNLLKLLHDVNIKSWIRVVNVIESFEVSVDFMVACVTENFLQDEFEDFKAVGVVR